MWHINASSTLLGLFQNQLLLTCSCILDIPRLAHVHVNGAVSGTDQVNFLTIGFLTSSSILSLIEEECVSNQRQVIRKVFFVTIRQDTLSAGSPISESSGFFSEENDTPAMSLCICFHGNDTVEHSFVVLNTETGLETSWAIVTSNHSFSGFRLVGGYSVWKVLKVCI